MSIIEVLKIYKQKFDADFCTNVIWDSINDQDIAMLYNDNNEIIFLKKGTINILYSIYLTTHYKNVDIEVSLYLNDIYSRYRKKNYFVYECWRRK